MKTPKNIAPDEISKMKGRDIANLSIEDRNRLGINDYKELANRAINLMNKRVRQLKNAGLYDYAYAKKYVDNIDFSETKDRAQAARQVAAIARFFRAKTSSLSGVRKVLKKEEDRIFSELNANSEERIHFEAEEQRKMFWSAYMEFMSQNPVYNNTVSSTVIQQYLGQIGSWRRGEQFTQDEFNQILDKLHNEHPELG